MLWMFYQKDKSKQEILYYTENSSLASMCIASANTCNKAGTLDRFFYNFFSDSQVIPKHKQVLEKHQVKLGNPHDFMYEVRFNLKNGTFDTKDVHLKFSPVPFTTPDHINEYNIYIANSFCSVFPNDPPRQLSYISFVTRYRTAHYDILIELIENGTLSTIIMDTYNQACNCSIGTVAGFLAELYADLTINLNLNLNLDLAILSPVDIDNLYLSL